MNRFLLASIVAVILSACGGNPRGAEPSRYDLGGASGASPGTMLAMADIQVQATSWLSATAMHYRLAYGEPFRRHSYSESRWAAPPAELLEVVLKHRLAGANVSGPGCRLQVFLEELEQRFDDPQSSQLVLKGRAVLLPARGSDMLARRSFSIQRASPTPDARGGAVAARDAALALADELAAWNNELAPATSARCRN